MKKTELIYREILYRATEKKERRFTQLEISKRLGLSLSVVNRAVKKLESIGAVRVALRSFNLVDVKKALYYWASVRSLDRDIVLKMWVDIPVREIERNMPDVIFSAYSGYKFLFSDVPADYSEVYVYADDTSIREIEKRFSVYKKRVDKVNLIILKKDKWMDLYEKIPLAQVFVDLWNLREWYAREYVLAFEKRLEVE